jgi:hypothetical protein
MPTLALGSADDPAATPSRAAGAPIVDPMGAIEMVVMAISMPSARSVLVAARVDIECLLGRFAPENHP